MAADNVRPARRARSGQGGKAAGATFERIVQAAVEEFGTKGYAGSRTADIAARAGVNQQLISYYFGGKQGLLDELRNRWAAIESNVVPSDASFSDAFSAYLDATLDNPNWSRLIVWQALGGERATPSEEQSTRLGAAVARTRRRQEAGEINPDFEPEFLLLLAYALAFAPLALPQFVQGIFGIDPLSDEYRQRCRQQLARLVEPAGNGTDHRNQDHSKETEP